MIKQMEKEFFIMLMVIDMKEILKIIKEMEKELIIIIESHAKVIDMKEIIEMINLREKEYFIIKMVIEEWVISLMVC